MVLFFLDPMNVIVSCLKDVWLGWLVKCSNYGKRPVNYVHMKNHTFYFIFVDYEWLFLFINYSEILVILKESVLGWFQYEVTHCWWHIKCRGIMHNVCLITIDHHQYWSNNSKVYSTNSRVYFCGTLLIFLCSLNHQMELSVPSR